MNKINSNQYFTFKSEIHSDAPFRSSNFPIQTFPARQKTTLCL